MNALATAPAAPTATPAVTTVVNAVYERGHLRLLDPVDLHEGERVQVQISVPVAQTEEQAKPSPTREEVRALMSAVNKSFYEGLEGSDQTSARPAPTLAEIRAVMYGEPVTASDIDDDDEAAEAALLAEFHEMTRGVPPLSEAIIEERDERR